MLSKIGEIVDGWEMILEDYSMAQMSHMNLDMDSEKDEKSEKIIEIIDEFLQEGGAAEEGEPMPSFETLISFQESSGYWPKTSEDTLRKYFKDDAYGDFTVLGILEK